MFSNHISPLVDKKRLPVCVAGLYIPAAGANPPAGFDSLNTIAGSRLISAKRYFYARNPSCDRIMAGHGGGALALAGSYSASLSTLPCLATSFDSVVVRLQQKTIGAVIMANSAHLLSPHTSTAEVRHV